MLMLNTRHAVTHEMRPSSLCTRTLPLLKHGRGPSGLLYVLRGEGGRFDRFTWKAMPRTLVLARNAHI